MPSACFNSQPIHATNPRIGNMPKACPYDIALSFFMVAKKSLAHREWVGKAMLDGMLFFMGDYSGLMSPSNGRGLKPSP